MSECFVFGHHVDEVGESTFKCKLCHIGFSWVKGGFKYDNKY